MLQKFSVKRRFFAALVLILLEPFSTCIYSQSTGGKKSITEIDPVDCKQCLILCEQSQNRIVIVELPSKEIIWEWKAINSNVSAEHREWFNFPDEAKPVYDNKYILITASGGGIALIRVSDKKVVFYAYAGGNPHSAEILPDGNIVSSSSTGNFLTLFKVDTVNFPRDIFFKSYPIKDGHNVVWDKKRQVLWAGSGMHLRIYKYNFSCDHPDLKLSDSIRLPDNTCMTCFPCTTKMHCG